jgi:predicted dehydrogenase
MSQINQSKDKIKVAVVGVGQLGQHHARIYAEMPEVELVGVVDVDPKRARKIARQHKTRAFDNYKELDGQVEAVNIVVPTPLHFELGSYFLEKGIHCLVEKPITPSLDEAQELMDITRRKNLILQVGHIERFNPAVMEAQKYIEEPKFIEANRLGPYSPRVADVSVVLDLMIHDIDIILYLVKSPIVSIDAIGACLLSKAEDIANVRINFANGCVANVSASRISLEKFRKIRIFQSQSYLSLDYAKPSLKIYRKKTEVIKSLKDISVKFPKLAKLEPLKEEIKHFIGCIREKREPLVSGEHGRDALEVCLEILNKIRGKK